MKNDLLKIDTRLPFLTCSNALSYGLRNPAKHKCEFNIGTIYYNANQTHFAFLLNKALYKLININRLTNF